MYMIGPHVSAAGGPANAAAEALRIGATGYALFVKNQRQWVGKPLSQEEIAAFKAAQKAAGFTAAQVLPHAGYLINLANPDAAAFEKSAASFLDELRRCEALGLATLNIHPGSHLKLIDPMAACDRVAEAINTALGKTSGVAVVVENTAGQGSYLGASFEELARILAGVDDRRRIGVCIDTAHAFGAGFDLRGREGYLRMMDHLDKTVGLRYLRGMHLNDSKGTLGAHLDRHETLGEGALGWTVFEEIARDPRCEGIPLILETPDEARWPQEVAHLLAASKKK